MVAGVFHAIPDTGARMGRHLYEVTAHFIQPGHLKA